MSLDKSIFLHVNDFARSTPWLHGFMSFFADVAGAVFMVLLLVAAAFYVRFYKKDAHALAVLLTAAPATVVALLIGQVVSQAAARPRPFKTLPHVLVLVARPTDYSFPSDHATLVGGLMVALLAAAPALLAGLAVLIGALLCFARMYVGVHYLTDVIGGLVLGGLCGTLSLLLLARPLQRALEMASRFSWLKVLVPAPAREERAS